MKKNSFFFIDEEDSSLSIASELQCIVDAIDKASTTNGLTDVWSKIQPKLENHLEAWKQCDTADSKAKIIL